MSPDDTRHHAGQSVDTVDQISSITLLGLALVGGAVAALLIGLIVHP